MELYFYMVEKVTQESGASPRFPAGILWLGKKDNLVMDFYTET